MNFKGSAAETRFNGIWDTSVVFYDTKIRTPFNSMRFFRSPTIDFSDALFDYKSCGINFIQNVSRQLSQYEDKKYFYQYLKEAKDTIISDLNNYKTILIDKEVFQYTETIEIYSSEVEAAFNVFDDLYSTSVNQNVMALS